MSRIVVIAAHPHFEHSHAHRALAEAAAGVPGVEVRALYRLYPEQWIDIAAEQAALAEAQLVVWLHPIHWYAMPALMKQWLDDVFAFGWAYGPGGMALRGKDLWLVTHTGGSEHSYSAEGYNQRPFDDYLHPYVQTAALCGMRWLAPLVLHGAHCTPPEVLQSHAEGFAAQLRSYPEWPWLKQLACGPECAVPADARPSTP